MIPFLRHFGRVIVSCGAALLYGPSTASSIEFSADIKPLLERHCVGCHGAEKQKGGLRLDNKSDALRGGDNGPVLVPGNPEKSRLWAAVSGTDPEMVMPPKGDRLNPEQLGRLRTWISEGVSWPEEGDHIHRRSSHWSFQPIKKPAVPKTRSRHWSRNAIDAFILEVLESNKIKPSPEADSSTLLRRVYLDLLGLLPTPDETARFLNDPSPNAYERLVDRLLESPHFGERWGRHWLDEARYADSDGYADDKPRPWAWTYRDWVIDAINRDLPFDQFTIEQLAGDLLPSSSSDQQRATGFHRNTLSNREGGIDPEEFRVKAVIDRVSTTGSVWLGLTVGCAECHTHKYDPITQREFYEFMAFFNSDVEEDIPVWMPGQPQPHSAEMAAWKSKLEHLQQTHRETLQSESKAFQDWKLSLQTARSPWNVLHPASFRNTSSSTLRLLEDSSLLGEEYNPPIENYFVIFTNSFTGLRHLRIDFLDNPADGAGLGRNPDGGFVITALEILLDRPGEPSRPISYSRVQATFSDSDRPVSHLISRDKKGWGVTQDPFLHQALVVSLSEPFDTKPGDKLVLVLRQGVPEHRNVRRFKVAASADPGLLPADHRLPGLHQIARDDSQWDSYLRMAFESQHEELRRKNSELEKWWLNPPHRPDHLAQTLRQNPFPRRTHVHQRGDFLSKGELVTPGTLRVLPSLEPRGAAPDRHDLAHWLVDRRNPLTSRVAVNKAWMHLFGRGIVSTVDDFGTRGEKPSHPELLDWLSWSFSAPTSEGGLGWSRKKLIRLIVTSATYRQSSRYRKDLEQKDPANRYMARQMRKRLEAEVIRDISLAAGGLLNPVLHGPGIRPPLPADIARLGWAVSYPESKGAERYRRGLYIFAQRTVIYPMLVTFDSPDTNTSCSRRDRSMTPLQPLTLLNDPVFVECARHLGKRMEASAGTVNERLEHGFWICFQRLPSPGEIKRLERAVRDIEALQRHSTLEEGSRPDSDEQVWIAVARTLLNLDEMITRE